MNKSRYILFCMLLLLIGGFSNCGEGTEEEKVNLQDTIQGDWVLNKAFRDKRETVALEQTFFKIKEDGVLTTNFNMEMKTGNHDYTLDKNIIRQKGEENITYHIYEASDTTLTLQTRYQGFEFKLVLEKRAKDSPE